MKSVKGEMNARRKEWMSLRSKSWWGFVGMSAKCFVIHDSLSIAAFSEDGCVIMKSDYINTWT